MNNEIDWKKVNRVLVVRLRSIGDTVLATPSLIALKRFLPHARIDILLEDWVAPVLDGFDAVDNVLTVGKYKKSRLETARTIRRNKYNVAFNLHGGTTAAFLVRATGAPIRVGYSYYQYSFLYTHLLSSPQEFWQREITHSAEQQLALSGFIGIPVSDRPKTRLVVTEAARKSIVEKLLSVKSLVRDPQFTFAMLHPVAAFESKLWATGHFARVAEYLYEKNIKVIAVGTAKEREVLENLKKMSHVDITIFDDLTLPEITALAARAKIFIGNDSGIAHIAAAVQTPSVVVFGSSNINHWRPWTNAPNEIVYEKMACQPCAGYSCAEFDKPECIRRVTVPQVIEAAERVFNKLQIEKYSKL